MIVANGTYTEKVTIASSGTAAALSGYGCPTNYNAVFGFEDRVLPSDADYSDVVFSTNLSTNATPEPSTVLLMAAGMLGLVGAARRRKAQA